MVRDAPRARLAGRVLREVNRRDLLPARVLWWLAAAGMRDGYATRMTCRIDVKPTTLRRKDAVT